MPGGDLGWGKRRREKNYEGKNDGGKGATDGTRTRDSQNHNLEFYQLNYGRHR